MLYSIDMDRRAHVIESIKLSGTGLELGPLYSPILSKSETEVYYVDHASTRVLRKKYKNHPFDVGKIVDVDYVLNGKTLKKTITGSRFDYVVASHVIEHIPDIIGWLNDISSVLKTGGVLSLVIPDKRYTHLILLAT